MPEFTFTLADIKIRDEKLENLEKEIDLLKEEVKELKELVHTMIANQPETATVNEPQAPTLGIIPKAAGVGKGSYIPIAKELGISRKQFAPIRAIARDIVDKFLDVNKTFEEQTDTEAMESALSALHAEDICKVLLIADNNWASLQLLKQVINNKRDCVSRKRRERPAPIPNEQSPKKVEK